jgi:phosphoribosylformylglycinamidine cyclo-ligase
MSRFLFKYKNKYFEWSNILDLPVNVFDTEEELKNKLKERNDYPHEIEERLKRLRENGNSLLPPENQHTPEELIIGNRAGDNEEELTIEQFSKKYCSKEEKMSDCSEKTRSEKYSKLGVSSDKEEIKKIVNTHEKGLYPNAFCKIVKDTLNSNSHSCIAMHSDGVGTKAIVAYLHYKEFGDPEIFSTLAQDAIAMNLNDLACIGATGPYIINNTIGRNKKLIPDSIIEAILKGFYRCIKKMESYDVKIDMCGGETADIGDLVRTISLDVSAVARLNRDAVIDNKNITSGNVIIGFPSAGKATYEDKENSGISSNGLTLARSALLNGRYREQYPEISSSEVDSDLFKSNIFELQDELGSLNSSIGEALLSPTRIYAPVIKEILKIPGIEIKGMIHNTGGGILKCLQSIDHVNFVKNNLFKIPPIFKLIKMAGNIEAKEFYSIFNMGNLLEIYVEPEDADEIINVAKKFEIDAKIIGKCVSKKDNPRLVVETGKEKIEWT